MIQIRIRISHLESRNWLLIVLLFLLFFSFPSENCLIKIKYNISENFVIYLRKNSQTAIIFLLKPLPTWPITWTVSFRISKYSFNYYLQSNYPVSNLTKRTRLLLNKANRADAVQIFLFNFCCVSTAAGRR